MKHLVVIASLLAGCLSQAFGAPEPAERHGAADAGPEPELCPDEDPPTDEGGRAADRGAGGTGRGWGLVTFGSSPWTYVSVDGTKLAGRTPIREAKLRAGRHRARLFNPELKLSRTLSFGLAEGEAKHLAVRFGGSEGSTVSWSKATKGRPGAVRRGGARHLPPCCGAVTFVSSPSSHVYVDGVMLSGQTPIPDVRLTAGSHVARFVAPEQRRSKTVTFRVAAGKTHVVRARLRRPSPKGPAPSTAADAGP